MNLTAVKLEAQLSLVQVSATKYVERGDKLIPLSLEGCIVLLYTRCLQPCGYRIWKPVVRDLRRHDVILAPELALTRLTSDASHSSGRLLGSLHK